MSADTLLDRKQLIMMAAAHNLEQMRRTGSDAITEFCSPTGGDQCVAIQGFWVDGREIQGGFEVRSDKRLQQG